MKYWTSISLLIMLFSGAWLFHEGNKHSHAIESLCSGAHGLSREQLIARSKDHPLEDIIYKDKEPSANNLETIRMIINSTANCTFTLRNNAVESYEIFIGDPKNEWHFE